MPARSTSVNGFRYNARILTEHLVERLNGQSRPRKAVSDLVSFLLAELSHAPELCVQKGYLCRVVAVADEGFVDDGFVPLAYFLDSGGRDAVAASVEVDDAGRIIPTVYVRRDGEIAEHHLEPHPLHDYEDEPYRRELALLMASIVSVPPTSPRKPGLRRRERRDSNPRPPA